MKRLLRLLLLTGLLALGAAKPAEAGLCTGDFVNPITDICWDCIFPISIGSIRIFDERPDPPNPDNILCTCPIPVPPYVRIGIAIGFWEPARLVDVTKRPYCFVNLGGLELDAGFGAGQTKAVSGGGQTHNANWHLHWYVYPVYALLELFVDSVCVSDSSFDIAYMTELDPLWLDDELTFLLNPEAVLFANPAAQAACAADCVAASAHLPLNALFWCGGCQGSMYPLGGNVGAHVGSIQSALLAAERLAYKLGRQFVLRGTSGPEALCQKVPRPVLKKTEWRMQQTNPVAATAGPFAGTPLGRTSVPYESGREIPLTGEDFGFLIWRKRNCCAY
ncbi:MAG: conjugal transfer pilus assembly protein TraU [Alphaproteobacteria bacterium]|nr:conjugal transfer pilus assembly protein TraU [Alphaproteobacteria bacterium]